MKKEIDIQSDLPDFITDSGKYYFLFPIYQDRPHE